MHHNAIGVLVDRSNGMVQPDPVTEPFSESPAQQVRAAVDAPLLGPALEGVKIADPSTGAQIEGHVQN